MKRTFAAALNCIDGRIQVPVIEYLKHRFAVDFVDMITEPGMCGLLAENREDAAVSIRNKFELSHRRHGAKLVAIVGHHDCAGFPVDEATQEVALRAAREVVGSWNWGIQVVCLWVDENGRVSEVG